MHVRCPNCNATMETLDSMDLSSEDGMRCIACGQLFSLVAEDTKVGAKSAPRMLRHFQLIEVVGQGGFGVVWRARDTELDRIVAVKMPRNSQIDAADASQFVREARAAAQLKHPNIVSIHEVGRIDDSLYIVTDYIKGCTLSEWLRDNRPTIRETAEMCRTMAGALQHAHDAGVIHRDIKPGNILLDADNTPYIADFGLALRQVGDMTVTFDGRILGTPAFMSPEQATGDSVDCRSDVYSLGVILFQMLTGERPFRGNHQMLLHQVINDEAPSPRRFNDSIARDLETICLRCLEKSAARRYATAQDLADELQRFIAGEPIRARPIRAPERLWKWALRRPLVASLLTAFVLAVVLGLAGVTWQWRRVVASQRRHAQTQLELIRNASPNAVEAAIIGLKELREWTDPELRKLAADTTQNATDRFRGHLALLDQEPERVRFVVEQLLRTTPPDVLDFDELALGLDVLAAVREVPREQLMDIASDSTRDEAARFRAVFMLARAEDSTVSAIPVPWDLVAQFSVRQMTVQATRQPSFYRTLLDTFRTVRGKLQPAFLDLLKENTLGQNELYTAAAIVSEYASDQPEFLCDLLLQIRPPQYLQVLEKLRDHREFATTRFETLLADQNPDLHSQKAVSAVTLLHLGDDSTGVWPLFRQAPDMSFRTLLIHRCAELNLPPEKLVQRLLVEDDVSVRRAILLAVGEYEDINAAVRNQLQPHLEDWYRHDPDAGIHSAVAWLLRRWNQSSHVQAMDEEPAFVGPVSDRQWYVNSQGTTLVVVDHPDVFLMGAPEGEPLRTKADRQHYRRIDRKLAIATTEVTWKQFQVFASECADTNHRHPKSYGRDVDGPVLAVSWIQAAKYCRWLSEKEGIADDQMCFPNRDEISDNMLWPDDLMNRTGYRLPSEGEWECVCRAGTITRRFFGETDTFLDNYGWHIGNSGDYAWPVGLLKPNDYGLFDVYGNAWEWCLDRHGSLPKHPAGKVYLDTPKLVGKSARILRGGSMNSRSDALRSAQRDFIEADHNRNHNVGFRIVRTLPPSADSARPVD